MDKRWARTPGARNQLALFSTSLEDAVAPGHCVRAFDACMDLVDWSPFEARYASRVGQPAIHPRLVASAILYGLLRNVRSSRALEDATRERIDFIWLLEGRGIDHATFAAFRAQFGAELKDLNRGLSRLVCTRFEGALLTLIIDGTRIRANSDRHGARTAEALERLIAVCAAELDRKLALLGDEDARATADAQRLLWDAPAPSETQAPSDVPAPRDLQAPRDVQAPRDRQALSDAQREIKRLEAKIARYERALGVCRERDAIKKAKDGKNATPVRVPVVDCDAQLAPNKEGGFAPNYTPVIAVDAATGLIVDNEVLAGADEASAVMPAVKSAMEISGRAPERVLGDSGFAQGENLAALDAMGIEAYMPTTADFRPSNPANRGDGTIAISPSDWDHLPLRGKKLASSAFIYDTENDCYHCPMGKRLDRVRGTTNQSTGVTHTQYQCPGKAGCPLADRCVRTDAHARTLTRDSHQPLRDAAGRRMITAEGREIYKARAPIVEGTFAVIKHHMGIRRFLMRGLEKVRQEWNWICTAYNIKKILAMLPKPQRKSPKQHEEPRRSPKIQPIERPRAA